MENVKGASERIGGDIPVRTRLIGMCPASRYLGGKSGDNAPFRALLDSPKDLSEGPEDKLAAKVWHNGD